MLAETRHYQAIDTRNTSIAVTMCGAITVAVAGCGKHVNHKGATRVPEACADATTVDCRTTVLGAARHHVELNGNHDETLWA